MKAVNLPNCGTLPDFGNFEKEVDHTRRCGDDALCEGCEFQCVDFAPDGASRRTIWIT
jgi:hypothetical protein